MQLAPRTNEMTATARIVRVLLMGRFQVKPIIVGLNGDVACSKS